MNDCKHQLSSGLREKYNLAMAKYRKRFLKEYVEILMPPSNNWEYSTQDARELKKESVKMFEGLAK